MPGSEHRVITCGASTRTLLEERAPFSNFGQTLSVVAPGFDVPTTVIQGTGTAGGPYGTDYIPNFWKTSASAPQVAGLAALILSVWPDLNSEQVRDVIESTADKIGNNPFHDHPNGLWNSSVGCGRINVVNAMKKATTLPFAESVPSRPFTTGG